MAYYRCRKKSGGSPTPITVTQLIPKMTSDTLPSGICSGYKLGDGQSAYYAFQNDNTHWSSGSYVTLTEKGAYVQYYFPQQVTLRQIDFKGDDYVEMEDGYGETQSVYCNYLIKTSLDGTTWQNVFISKQGNTYFNDFHYKQWLKTDVVCNYIRIELFSDCVNARIEHIKAYGAVGNVQIPAIPITHYGDDYPIPTENSYIESHAGPAVVDGRFAGNRRLLKENNWADYLIYYEDIYVPAIPVTSNPDFVSFPLNDLISGNWEIELNYNTTNDSSGYIFEFGSSQEGVKILNASLNGNQITFSSDYMVNGELLIEPGTSANFIITKRGNSLTVVNSNSQQTETEEWNNENLSERNPRDNMFNYFTYLDYYSDFIDLKRLSFRFLDD